LTQTDDHTDAETGVFVDAAAVELYIQHVGKELRQRVTLGVGKGGDQALHGE
jgi:hypothetical protein